MTTNPTPDTGRPTATPRRSRCKTARGSLLGAALGVAVLAAASCSDNPADTTTAAAPPPAPAVDCYTPSDGPQVPHDTNQYAIVLVDDPGAQAGALDEYDACKHLPVTNPATAADCYTTGSEPEHLRDVNRYAVALLAGTTNAGALDEYARCQFLPVVRPEPSEG